MEDLEDYNFEGWLGLNPDSVHGKMEWQSFHPKPWTENDVDIKITHCGVCGSDIHTLSSGWGRTPYPCCVGHEIVGFAVRVGDKVDDIKIGDRVGVGAQALSCLRSDCSECSIGLENYCQILNVGTAGSIYPDGERSYGGFANYNRTDGRFVFRIPDGLLSEEAAPMLCGGISVYAPLKNNACGPGKSVGVIGIGGLGHLAILFSRALGADHVVGISRNSSKRDDALNLGVDTYIGIDGEENWVYKYRRSLDIIICTAPSRDMPMDGYLKLLKVGGSLIQLGIPDGAMLPAINAFTLLANGVKFGGSGMGSPSQIKEMLELAERSNIKPWIEKRAMKDANNVIVDMEAGKPRFRYVLVNKTTSE